MEFCHEQSVAIITYGKEDHKVMNVVLNRNSFIIYVYILKQLGLWKLCIKLIDLMF